MRVAIAVVTMALGACASLSKGPGQPMTFVELAERCDMTTVQLDSLLEAAAQHARTNRGVELTPGLVGVMLSTTGRPEGKYDCRAHAALLSRTVVQ